jgi:hypothetical protein
VPGADCASRSGGARSGFDWRYRAGLCLRVQRQQLGAPRIASDINPQKQSGRTFIQPLANSEESANYEAFFAAFFAFFFFFMAAMVVIL